MDETIVDVVARIIYDTVYGPEIEEGEMPSFSEAKTEDIGGYELAMQAARNVLAAAPDQR